MQCFVFFVLHFLFFEIESGVLSPPPQQQYVFSSRGGRPYAAAVGISSCAGGGIPPPRRWVDMHLPFLAHAELSMAMPFELSAAMSEASQKGDDM